MTFYLFEQNNSGGSLNVDDELCHRVYIEANSLGEANEKAQRMGVYFDGVGKGIDCGCCGDRWYAAKKLEPASYGKDTVEEAAQHLADEYGWTTPDGRIFYDDGGITEVFIKSAPIFKKPMEAEWD